MRQLQPERGNAETEYKYGDKQWFVQDARQATVIRFTPAAHQARDDPLDYAINEVGEQYEDNDSEYGLDIRMCCKRRQPFILMSRQ